MKEFLDRADKFIKLEEAVRQAQTGKVDNRQSQGILQPHDLPDVQAGTSNFAQTSSGRNIRAIAAKTTLEDTFEKKGKYNNSPTTRNRKFKEEKYTCFTLLAEKLEVIFMAT
uniref:Uncharacterized protein n=1 Tax=Cannabis sativa TaxID=3483 RepID=A0A803PSL0_CANSA